MPSIQRRSVTAKRRQPEHIQHVAALISSHPPTGRSKLVADPQLNLYSELSFLPIPDAPMNAIEAICFGVLSSGYLPRSLAFSTLPVKRGRWGSKPPEQLLLLQPLPQDFETQPGTRQRGMLRSIPLAFADISAALQLTPPTTREEWFKKPEFELGLMALAVEFAFHGWAESATISAKAQPAKGHAFRFSQKADSAVLEREGKLVWGNWLDRMAAQLLDELNQARQRNPLRREISVTMVSHLLHVPKLSLAGLILERFAMHSGLPKAHSGHAKTYLLAGELAPPQLAPELKELVGRILRALETAKEASRRDLAAMFQGQLNVLAWLFDAEELVELPGYRVVSRATLRGYLKRFPIALGRPSPSVRELKDELGLGRRTAEALRAWYVLQSEEAAR